MRNPTEFTPGVRVCGRTLISGMLMRMRVRARVWAQEVR